MKHADGKLSAEPVTPPTGAIECAAAEAAPYPSWCLNNSVEWSLCHRLSLFAQMLGNPSRTLDRMKGQTRASDFSPRSVLTYAKFYLLRRTESRGPELNSPPLVSYRWRTGTTNTFDVRIEVTSLELEFIAALSRAGSETAFGIRVSNGIDWNQKRS